MIKTLVMGHIPEDQGFNLIPKVIDIYHKDHFCDYLNVFKTVEAVGIFTSTIWYVLMAVSMLIKPEQTKLKAAERNKEIKIFGLIAIILGLVNVGANLIYTPDLKSTASTLILIFGYFWFFILCEDQIRSTKTVYKYMMLTQLALMTAGTVGNQVEQMLRGYVVDYLILFFGSGLPIQSYVFNFEDVCCIVGRYVGISALILIYVNLSKEGRKTHDR